MKKQWTWGASGIEFTNYINQGNAKNMASDNILNPDQKTDFFRQLRESRKVIPKETLIIDRSGIFGSDLENIKCHFNCPAGSNLVVVTLDNNVYPCIFLA